MSLSPVNILQRLKELKTWQENHEELLKKTKNLNKTTLSDYESIEGLSAFDSTLPDEAIKNWESQVISPTKTFNELLEEKLAEDPGPRNISNKPKKPFLKKGSGLQRFRMTTKPQIRQIKKLKKNEEMTKMTPLRAPDLSVRPKASWQEILNEPSEQSLYEKALEKELLIFEALEEKAENSSFCSTNSSVLRILSSTPSKISKKTTEPPIFEKDEVIESSLEKSDITEILMRLKNLVGNQKLSSEEEEYRKLSSEEEEYRKLSSTEEESSSLDTSLSSSDLEMTLKRDVATTTGEDYEESINNCAICGDRIEKKILEYEEKIQEVINDKNIINQIKKQLEEKEKQFENEKKNLLYELENEKKKLIKEKQFYQMYTKESQNRPSKKEREEISNLKQEIADLSETLKLKESKNGMTQARLRNQIKQLEKENTNLKSDVEKLTKENAKLSASQKLNRRQSETKILHNINKNITKLTEETKKNKQIEEDKEETKKNKRIEEEKDDSLIEIQKQYETTFRKSESKQTQLLDDGTKQIKYPNGNVKTISPDGNFITVKYFNGDIQETNLLDGTVKYFFSTKKIWQTTFPDGFELVEFPDGIKEKRYVDGKCEVILPDDVIQVTLPDGTQETKYPDGSVVTIKSTGDKVLLLPNGQKEIETKDYKKREYPDGTVKTLYPDGTQETKYSNGRVRIKDKNGTLIMDTQS